MICARIGLAGILLLVTATAWAQASAKILRVAPSADVQELDPTRGRNLISRIYSQMVFDTLFALDQTLSPKPMMVDKETVSDDRAVQELFARFDVLATPTMTAPPKPLNAGGSIATEMYAEWGAPLYPFNLTAHPALSVPAGFTADGLPVGLQLVGPWFGEEKLLHLASLLEAKARWHERRPPI